MTPETFTGIARNDKRLKLPPIRTYAYLTLAECQALRSGAHVLFITRQGDIAPVRVTSVKLWKTRPLDVRIGLKYGLCEYAQAEFKDGTLCGNSNILVREINA